MNQITMKLQADHLILEALKEDISSEDVTTNSVMKEAVAGEVDLICKQDGIIAGLEVFERVFTLLDPDTKAELYCKDGEEVKNGQLMGKVKGDIRVLLSGERVALNYLQRMSGIATYTNSVAKLLEGSKIKLLDTRKTTPNMRIFEKYAVRAGGGYNHRYNLSDGVLLKDNHIGAAGSVTKAVQMAKEYAPFVRKIEVEVENLDMVKEAVEAGADIIMLDNMSPEDMKKAVELILGTEIKNLYGPGYITDKIGNIEYRISPLSFYQVNPVQTERLYGTALEFADLNGGETVWDLYCGIGTISSFLARKAGKVCGVEIIPVAIEDARENAKRNGLANVEFFVGKAEEVLPEQYEKNHIKADVIVVDPPRKGCDELCLETIVKMAPEKVVYVSCDSSTLARDVKYLGENGYEVKRVRTVDMFGMSGHVETVALLTKKCLHCN